MLLFQRRQRQNKKKKYIQSTYLAYDIQMKLLKKGDTMRRLCGFVLFWIAVGMAISLLIKSTLLSLLLVVILFLCGYNLFCC